ncbi:Aldose sugar dehydrogenase YliI [bacterium HR19]|nr:Aldose sugar dehydrogenase YliI [bacterium HR19]
MQKIKNVFENFKYLLFLSTLAFSFCSPLCSRNKDSSYSSQKIQEEKERRTNQNDFEVIIENLEIPWTIIFINRDEILITERPGKVKIFSLQYKKLIREFQIEGIKHIGEGGLLGATIHPDFKENNFIYLYYTTEQNGNLINRVERYILKNYELIKDKIILNDIPAGRIHNGGRIKFGPDGHLYITTGDAGNSDNSQNINSLAGKILRVEEDGSIPEDNPFGNYVYAYGIRNSQGIAWDAEGNLWAIDHGRSGIQSGLDEVNLIEKGRNYGWPVIQGDERKEGMETPITHSGEDTTWAPADLIYYNNSLFFTGLRGQAIYKYDITNRKLEVYFSQKFGRLRAITIGPDGYFYVSTSNRDGRGYPNEGDDKILKINPEIFFDSVSYKLEGKFYNLLVADEPAEWLRGLMFARKCADGFFDFSYEITPCLNWWDGMIFIFPDKMVRSFWNKNTLVDIDIYWINDDDVIGKAFLPSFERTKKIYTVTSPSQVNKVVEIIN